MIELEAADQIGAGHYERTPERKTYRNGHREPVWETRVEEIPFRIPKLRDGTYFPSLLGPRRRSEKALLAIVQQAYVEGVSTRRVDDLLHIVPRSLREALGLTGIDTPAPPAGHPVRAASPRPPGPDGPDGVAGGARESRVSRICKEVDEVGGAGSQPPAGAPSPRGLAGCALPEVAPESLHAVKLHERS